MLFALLAGIAGTTWGLFEAKRQEALANERQQGERLAKRKALAAADQEKRAKETVEDVLGFVEDKVFAAARPKDQEGGLGHDVKLADAIRAALPSIETRFRNKPLTERACAGRLEHPFISWGSRRSRSGNWRRLVRCTPENSAPITPTRSGS